MLHTRVATYFLVVILLATDAWAGNVRLSARMDEEMYEFGAPIQLHVWIVNETEESQRLIRSLLDYPTAGLVEITAPSGAKVVSLGETPRLQAGSSLQIIELQPGESFSMVIELQQHFPDTYPTGMPHNFDEPGTYTLNLHYRIPESVDIEELYHGPITSEALSFIVKPLTGARLAELLSQLNSDSSEAVAEALNLLRRGKAAQNVQNLFEFLNVDRAAPVRVAAAYAIYRTPEAASERRCIEYLKDSDSDVRGFMALSLGSIGGQDGADALVEVTDPSQYPDSYAAAFKALSQLGDPRLLEIATRLKETAPSAVIREMARQVEVEILRQEDLNR